MAQNLDSLQMHAKDMVLVTPVVQPPDVEGNGYSNESGIERTASITPSSTVNSISSGILTDLGPASAPAAGIVTSSTSLYQSTIAPSVTSGPEGPATTSAISLVRTGSTASQSNGISSSFVATKSGTTSAPISTPPTTSSVHDNDKPDSPVSIVAASVGTVVPVACIVLFSALFCWWYQKKRARDRKLDDLERTAVWVTSGSETSQISAKQDPSESLKNNTAEAGSGMRSGQHASPGSMPTPGPDAVLSPINTHPQLLQHEPYTERDPFATPPNDEQELVRSSQIGLAVTTSSYSDASSDESFATVIRHSVCEDPDPFYSDPESSNDENNSSEVYHNGGEPSARKVRDDANIMRSSTDTVIYSPMPGNQ